MPEWLSKISKEQYTLDFHIMIIYHFNISDLHRSLFSDVVTDRYTL